MRCGQRQTVDLLQEEHERHPDHLLLFPLPKTGTYLDPPAVARKMKTLLKRAGIDEIRFHDLRHTFATLSLQNGVDVKTLSHTLGHYSAGFTLDTYTHVTTPMAATWIGPTSSPCLALEVYTAKVFACFDLRIIAYNMFVFYCCI